MNELSDISGPPAARAPNPLRTAGPFLLAYGILLGIAFLAAEAPGVPYNVRELFGRGGALALAGFPIAVAILFGPPAWIARWAMDGGWSRAGSAVGLVAAHALAVWAVLRAGVPLESIHDVVGSPILRWPGDLETALRFVALFTTISALYVCGAILAEATAWVAPPPDRRAPLRWLAAAAPVLIVGHLVVVTFAATDNLTELMAGNGTMGSSLYLGMAVLVIAAATTALAGIARRRARVGIGILLLVVGLPLGWAAMQGGTAHEIEKYGRTFSALQFVLSPDRDHYAPTSELFARFALAYAAMIVMGGVAQAPFLGGRRKG